MKGKYLVVLAVLLIATVVLSSMASAVNSIVDADNSGIIVEPIQMPEDESEISTKVEAGKIGDHPRAEDILEPKKEVKKAHSLVPMTVTDDCNGNVTLFNEYVKACIGRTGRFTMGTTGGDPDNVTDNDKEMLFGFPCHGSTSYTTIRIDDTNYKYEADLGTAVIDKANNKYISSMLINGKIRVTEELSIVNNLTTQRADTVQIKYIVNNEDTESHTVGVRIMMDTMLGDNDDAPFRIPGDGDVIYQKEYAGNNIPQYWQVFDSLTNPSVIACGTLFMNLVDKPSRVHFTYWGMVTGTPWGHIPDENEEIGDSAVCVIWDEKTLTAGESLTYITYYGLSSFQTSQLSDYNVSITAPQSLNLTANSGNYEPNPFTIIAYVQNITSKVKSNVTAKIVLPAELTLFDTSNQTWDIGTLQPNEIKSASWIVFATAQTAQKDVQYIIQVNDGTMIEEVTNSITLPQVFEQEKTIADLGFVKTVGTEYQQTMALAKNTVKPAIKKGNITTLDEQNGKYRFTINMGDFVCDSAGYPFFFWKTDEGIFTSISDDCRTVEFTANPGTGGRKVTATAYIGDSLGYVGQYVFEVNGIDGAGNTAGLTCEFSDTIPDVKAWNTLNLCFNAYFTDDSGVLPGTIIDLYYLDTVNGIQTWQPIVKDLVDRSNYQWLVPNKGIASARIRLVARNGSASKTIESNVFTISPTLYVYGKVLTVDNQPVIGAPVKLGSLQTTTDESGYFIFKDIDAGSYTLLIEGIGYITPSYIVQVSNSNPEVNKTFRKR